MSTTDDPDDGPVRDFGGLVRDVFASVAAEYRLTAVGDDGSIVTYRGDAATLRIHNGGGSCELSAWLVLDGNPATQERPLLVSDCMRVVDPDLADRYMDFSARTLGAVRRGLERLAADVARYMAPALQGDEAFIARALVARADAWHRWVDEINDSQEIPVAEAAFKARDWRRAVELYERREARLDKVERKRLEIARKRLAQR